MLNIIKNKNNIHFIFFFILALNYLFPLIIFGKITLFYHDALDSEIVYNKILGKFLKKEYPNIELFLNGEIRVEYLRRLLFPITFFYYFFKAEIAFWLIDIIVKLVSYFSFYNLSKKINDDKVISCLIAALYASINYRSQDGLGMAIFPYLVYLITFKNNLNLKHYFFVIFFGLNTDFATCIPQLPILIAVSLILNKDKKKTNILNNSIIILTLFLIFVAIANSNMIYSQLFQETSHRVDFQISALTLKDNFLSTLIRLVHFPNDFSWVLVRDLPLFLIYSSTLLMFAFLFLKKKFAHLNFFILIIFMNILLSALNSKTFANIISFSPNIFKSFDFKYFYWSVPFVYLISICYIVKNFVNYKKVFKLLFLSCLIFFQINSSIVPIYKKFIIKENNYRNIYTFDGYYMYKEYSQIKKIIKNQKTISIGYDPMVAIMNDIHSIDGYHNFYPLKYKIQFRNIIEKELNNNLTLKNYYDKFGSRVYAFISDPNKIEINFKEAKKIGAKFVISKYQIINLDLTKILVLNSSNKIYLYKIN